MVVRRGQIRRKDIGSPGRPVSYGLQVHGEPGIVGQKRDLLGDLPAAGVFPSKYPSIVPAEMRNTAR